MIPFQFLQIFVSEKTQVRRQVHCIVHIRQVVHVVKYVLLHHCRKVWLLEQNSPDKVWHWISHTIDFTVKFKDFPDLKVQSSVVQILQAPGRCEQSIHLCLCNEFLLDLVRCLSILNFLHWKTFCNVFDHQFPSVGISSKTMEHSNKMFLLKNLYHIGWFHKVLNVPWDFNDDWIRTLYFAQLECIIQKGSVWNLNYHRKVFSDIVWVDCSAYQMIK